MGDQPDLDERFAIELAERPEVLELLRRYALQAARSTKPDQPLSMKAITERARWDLKYGTKPAFKADGYDLNNSLTSRYARHLAATEPELAGRFQMRRLTSRTTTPPAPTPPAQPVEPTQLEFL